MKILSRISVIIALLAFITFYSCGKKNTDTSDSKTSDSKISDNKVETAADDYTIKYNLLGNVKGEMITYKKGKRIMEKMYMNLSEDSKMSTSTYFYDNYVYTVIDFNGKKAGTKIDASSYKSNGAKEGKDIDFADMENYLKGKNKIGKETIIGKGCDIYEVSQGVKLSVTKNYIPLKIETNAMTLLAVSYDDKVTIPASEMEIPKDVKFSDPKEMLEGLLK